jgi:hypothetical protein
MQQIIDFFNNTFGSIGKWIMLAVLCVAIILGIVLFSYVVANLKWILLGAAILVVVVGIGLIIYKKVKPAAPKV